MINFDINDKYLVFDFETESLSETHARPWQIGFCVYENSNEVFSYASAVKWKDGIKMSDGAAKQTHFNMDEYLTVAKPAEEVFEIFWKYLYDKSYIVCGHNLLGYDVQINNVVRREFGLGSDYSYLNRLLDTNALAKGLKMGEKIQNIDNFLAWQYRMLNIKVKGLKTNVAVLCKEFEIPFDENRLHEALYDVRRTFDILSKLLFKIKNPI